MALRCALRCVLARRPLRAALSALAPQVESPRLVCYQAESHELAFTSTGSIMRPACAFDDNVRAVLAKVQVIFPHAPQFNTCIINMYKDGACTAQSQLICARNESKRGADASRAR
jgi:hypothetical protein